MCEASQQHVHKIATFRWISALGRLMGCWSDAKAELRVILGKLSLERLGPRNGIMRG